MVASARRRDATAKNPALETQRHALETHGGALGWFVAAPFGARRGMGQILGFFRLLGFCRSRDPEKPGGRFGMRDL